MLAISALSVFGIIVLFLGFSNNKSALMLAAMLSLLATFGLALYEWQHPEITPAVAAGMMSFDNLSILFTAVLLVTGILLLPISERFLVDPKAQPAEYYAILLFSMVGAIMMVTFDNLIMLFLGLEILSISLYVLTGSDKRNLLANEAALKYFLMGAFATGVLLYGVAMLYGAAGSFSLTDIALYVQDNHDNLSPMLYIGLFMMLVGMLFKLSVAPFHWWTADVYTGAPNFFTAYMSTIVKTAGFAALYKILSVSFVGVYDYWFLMLAICAVLTLFIGNLTATAQQSFKRMMAYSGVSHAGYMLIAVASFSDKTPEAIFFYSLAYSIATITAFAALMRVADTKGSADFAAFYGLAKTNPFLSFALTVSMLSLAGIPLTAGFMGKLFVFMSALEQGHVALVVAAVLMSAVGVYYYLRVVIAMYMREGNGVAVTLSPRFRVVLIATTVLTILLGVVPSLVAGAL